jgi:hypothetical protein
MRNFLRCLLGATILALCHATIAVAQSGATALQGDWRLVSFQTVIDGQPPQDLYGASRAAI